MYFLINQLFTAIAIIIIEYNDENVQNCSSFLYFMYIEYAYRILD